MFNLITVQTEHGKEVEFDFFPCFLFSHRSHTPSPILTPPSQNKSYDRNYQIDTEGLSMEPAPNNLVKKSKRQKV